jgi:para-nitrobenzyl esterase
MKRCCVSILLAASTLALPAGAAGNPPVVAAPAGKVQGEAVGDVHVFKGIPYARPPVGELRWKPPLPMPKWKGTRVATQFGAACIQPKGRPDSIYYWSLPQVSEDCLYLNIWAPANAKKAPVFFWIHGGALSGGSGGEPLYDGARMAERGIVVVTINYRLGPLGFLVHPALSAESRRNISGNYGLLDQVEALGWVKRNIASFGGDPANVTIAGESAGGLSVMYLMAAPGARGLFAKAVMQSAYMVSAQELRTASHDAHSGEAIGMWLQGKLGAGDLAGLRSMDAQKITDVAAANGFFPFFVIDGRLLPRQIVEVFDRGEQAKVPILAGFNSGEIRSLRALAPPVPADAATYEKEIRERYKDLADAFLKLYPASNLQESIWATTRDSLYSWTAERLSIKQTAVGSSAYLYLFDHGYPAANEKGMHAFHASEIPYMFGNADRTPLNWPKIPATDVEKKLSDAMLDYWTSFARDGVPTAAGQPAWSAYGASRAYLAFEDAPQPKAHVFPGMYEFNEQVVCRRRAAGGIPWHWNVGLASPPLPPEAPQCR